MDLIFLLLLTKRIPRFLFDSGFAAHQDGRIAAHIDNGATAGQVSTTAAVFFIGIAGESAYNGQVVMQDRGRYSRCC